VIRLRDFEGRPYPEARRDFRWRIPARYNIGVEVCDRWAAREPDRPAIYYESEAGARATVTYGALREASDRLANGLAALGVERGDRVAVILHQRAETAAAHIAVYKMGAIAVPLTRMFGPDALVYRLAHSGCRAAIVDPSVVPRLAALHDRLPALETVIVAGADAPDLPPAGAGRCRYLSWTRALERAGARHDPAPTGPDDPALIIYTSGTTGPPKGALHGHRILLGHLPSVQLYFDFAPREGAVYWTPADWAWIGGAYDLLFPALQFGGPVVAFETTRFDPERAFHLMAAHGVTHAFLPPTALKMAMQVEAPARRHRLVLQAVMSGGEPVNPVILEWRDRELPGVRLHEIYGQTEANLVCGNCSRLYPVRPGSLGRAFPGHEVIVVDDQGAPVAPGEAGEIAVLGEGDPVVFKEYWGNPEATAAKYRGRWLLTGDVARMDEDGYFYFEGRTDDVINSAGYRIGPAEVESSLLTHPAVAEAAAVGAPDPVRGQIVKGFVRLRAGFAPSDALAAEIQSHVKTRLAAYAYPRAIEFIDEMPMTTTGKIRRQDLRARATATPAPSGRQGS
jgi:acetyl-CoA synthetase